MSRIPWGRIIIILIVLAVSALLLVSKPILYGLDLRGGSHLLLRVHADEAIESEVDDAHAAVKNIFEENEIVIASDALSIVFDESVPYTLLADASNTPPYFEFTLEKNNQLREAEDFVRQRVSVGREWSMSITGNTIRCTLNPSTIRAIRAATIDNVRRAIEMRINKLGVSEPNIVLQGDPAVSQRILLQLPGVEDPEEAKTRIQTPGNLEFRMVVYDDGGVPYEGEEKEDILSRLNNEIPTGTELVPEYERTSAEAAGEARIPARWILLYKEARINSSYMIDARRSEDEYGKVSVAFTLNAEGGERIRLLSRDNIGKLLATVLDGEAVVVANISSELGSQSHITGSYTQAEADRLAFLLRSGAIPTSMHVEEDRSVGPSLGADSIKMGVEAFIWGMVVVALFMVVYYRLAGVLAVCVLSLNIVLILAILVWFDAVLTVPGIAGIILTIGMAVDANVIIFERIREERNIGRSVIGSVDSGFGKAFGTIFDANITTLIAAIFLFQFGTGPIRGFATTITIGILASMFTAIFVARTIFDLVFALKQNKVQKLSI